MKRIIITYGLIVGGILSVFMLITSIFIKDMDTDVAGWIGFTSIILTSCIIFFALASFKKNNGTISFGQGFKIGLAVSLIASFMYAVTWTILVNTVMTNWMSDYGTQVINKMKAHGASAAELQAKMAEFEHYKDIYKNPLFTIGVTMLEPFPIALAITVIAALILKTKKKALNY